jgi:hypothetical protein
MGAKTPWQAVFGSGSGADFSFDFFFQVLPVEIGEGFP